jgi:hypothetical protein
LPSTREAVRSISFVAMKKLLFLRACLVALASQPVMAQTGGADVVVVKVLEGGTSTELYIARPGSKPEQRVFKYKELSELGNGKSTGGEAEVLRRLLVEFAQQGYSLRRPSVVSARFTRLY